MKSSALSTILLALFLVGPAYAQDATTKLQKPLVPFEFKGIVAGQPVSPQAVGITGCSGDSIRTTCFQIDQVAGSHAVIQLQFRNGRLFALLVRGERDAFSDTIKALTAKYGDPCASETGNWRNGLGAVLDNPSFEWCFSTGELVATAIGDKLTEFTLAYLDKGAEPEAPKVDF